MTNNLIQLASCRNSDSSSATHNTSKSTIEQIPLASAQNSDSTSSIMTKVHYSSDFPTIHIPPIFIKSVFWHQIVSKFFNLPEITPDSTPIQVSSNGFIMLKLRYAIVFRKIQKILLENKI